MLKDNDIRHIDRRHGSGSNDKYKADADRIVGAGEVIRNWQNLYLGYDTAEGNKTIVYEYRKGQKVFYVEEILTQGGLSSRQMIVAGENSKPSFLKKYVKIASRSNSDTSVTAQDRATGSDTRQYQSPPGDHVQDERKSDGYAATIPQSGGPVKGAARPNLEEIRGRDVDAMTVNGLEYSVTATVNGYTARIADGNTTLWVKRGIENRTRAVDALEDAEVAGTAPSVGSADSSPIAAQQGRQGGYAENITEQEGMNDGRGNGTDGDTGEADADSRREGGGSAELSPAEWAARRAEEAADGEEIRVGGYTLQHTYIPSEEDSGCRLAARDIPEAAKVVFFTGEVRKSGILIENVNGTVSRDGTVYLRADSRERDVRQSARHERWHLLVMKDTQLGIRGEEALRRVYSDTELESLMAVYRDIYEIAYGVRDDNGNLLNADAVDQKVLQEICADAYAFIAEHDERISAASGEINRTQAEEYKAWKQRDAQAAEAAEKERQRLLLQKTLADLVRGRSDKALAGNLNAMGAMTLEEMKAAIREVLTELGVAGGAPSVGSADSSPIASQQGRQAPSVGVGGEVPLLDLRTDAEIAEAQRQERRQQRAQVAEEKRRSRETSRAEAAKEYAQRRVTLDRDEAALQKRIADSAALTGEARRLEMQDISEEYTRLEYEDAELTRLLRKSKGLCSLAIDEESNHIDRRSADDMGERDIKAFGYDYPELHPYYAEAAGDMLSALDRSVKGEKFFSWTEQEGNTDVDGLMITAQNRQTIPAIAWLLDDCGLSYARIENACRAIAENSDKQNNRDAKLVELALNTMLSDGWTDMDGYSIPENQEYINAKSAIPGAYTTGNDAEGDAYELPLSVGRGEAQNEYEYPDSETAMYSDGKIYSYDFLTHQKPLKLVTLPDISAIEARGNREQFRDNVQRAGMQNAKEHGTADGNFAYVKNSYSGRTLRISKETILHSLDGNWARMNDNGRFGAVIGEVIQNAIPINALKTSKNQVYGTYAMAAYAKDLNRDYIAIITVEQRDNSVKDIKLVDVAHSVSVRAAKRSEASTVDQVPGYDSEIKTERNPHTDASSDSMSIADFLQIVKRTHQGILSDDVRSVIGGERRADSRWVDSALFSIGGEPKTGSLFSEEEFAAMMPKQEDEAAPSVGFADSSPIAAQQGSQESGKSSAAQQGSQGRNAADLTGFAALNGREQDNERSTRPESRRDFGGTEATEKAGIRISGSLVGNWGQTDMLRAQNEGARLAGENARAAERYFHPSPAMKAFAQGVAEGIYTLDQTPQDMNRRAVAELSEAYRLRSSAEQGTLREQRREITRNVQQAVRQIFADSEAYKSEAKGILKPFSKALMNERTPERVLRSIFGAEVGARAYNYLFRPMYENNAEKVRWMNRQKAEVETLTDSRGRKRALTDAEKECAQYVLEGRGFEYAMENLEQYDKDLVQPHVDAFRERLELQKDKNFERCSQWVQLIADKELDMADAKERAKDLDCEELFEKALENSSAMAGLRQLPEELQRIADGLNWYAQRKAEMETRKDADTTIVENAAKLYGEKYDLFYKVINEHLVMHGYEEIGYIEGYAPHMQRQETQSKTRKALSLLGIQLDDVSELPASIAGRTAEFKPNMRWNPHFQHRSGGTDYESNIVRGFESYLDYMGDIIYHTDDIMKLREAVNYYRSTYAGEEIAENLSMANLVREGTKDEKRQFLQGRGLDYAEGMSTAQMNQVIDDYISRQYENAGELSKYSEFTTWLENAANLMAGKQSLADRGLEYSGGRKMLGLSRALMGSFAKANVAGSISSMLNQTAQLPMIITRLGEKYTLAAIRDMASGKLKAENFTTRSDYLTGKKGVDMIEKGSTAERALSALFRPAGMVDELISTVAVRGEYLRQLDKGMSDETALRRADDFGRRIMGSRVKGEKPQGFESKRFFSQMLHVFQVECMNTWDYVATDMPQEIRDIQERQGRNAAARTAAAAIVGYLLRAFLLNRLSDELYGGTPANMDLFGMTAEFFASGRGLPTNRYLLWAIDNGTEKLTDTRIFGTRREEGSEDFDTAEALSGLAYNVSNDLPYVRNAAGILGLGDQTLPTVGVNEIAKGAKSIWKGALGEDGKLGGGDAYGQQMVRGALDIAAQTVPMGRQLKKTATGAMTMAQGGSYSGYGDRQKLQYAVPGTVWNWSRALLFGNNALGEQEEFYAGDAKTLSAAETWVFKALRKGGMDTETAYDTMKEYDSIGKDKSMSSTERAIAKRKLLAGMQVEEPAKLEAWLSLEADGDVENGKYQGMLSLMEQGAKFGELMGLYNRYQELESNDNLKASEKATRFAQAVDELSAKSGWTEDMADEAKELWKYRVSSVVEARDYERLMDTGRISANEAVRVQQVWAGLQPEKGKESVSQVQKLYGIDVVLESEEKCWAAAETLMDTEEKTNEDGDLTEYGKLCWCRDNGVSYETYCDARRDGLLEGLTRYGEYMDTEAALKVSGRIRELEPPEGKKSVSVAQKAIAVTRLDIDEDYKLAYLEDVLEDSSFRKLDIATGYGVTAAIWGEYMSIRDKYDANGNGSYTQAEVQAAIESMRGLTTKQRAALWSMATLGKNNPFDRALGTEFKSKAGK